MPSQTSKRRQQSFNMLLRNVLLQFFIVKGNYILANKWILRKTSFHFSVFCQISIENWRLEGIFGIGLEIYQRKCFTNLWSRSNKRETWTKSFFITLKYGSKGALWKHQSDWFYRMQVSWKLMPRSTQPSYL